jgi:tRNA(His) 5'-end guanylyltransferase
MQGFEVAYHQSDEVSFLITDYSTLETSAWFDYNVQKVATIAASVMTAHFNFLIQARTLEHAKDAATEKRRDAVWDDWYLGLVKRFAYFDARAYNVPKEDVSNYYLWRCKDWERNSTQMYCRQFFSSKQMHGQGRADQHEMLHKIGKNWAVDVPAPFRNGTFILKDGREETEVRADYPSISALVDPLVYKTA